MNKLLVLFIACWILPRLYAQPQETAAIHIGEPDTLVEVTLSAEQPDSLDDTADKWQVNFDVTIVSRFIWRGLELGEYPSIQPNVTFSKKSFFVGIWSSHALAPAETPANNIVGYKEVIPYVGYTLGLGERAKLSLLVLSHFNPNVGGFLDYRRANEPAPQTNRVEVRTLFYAGKFDFLGSVDVYNDPTGNVSTYLEVGYTLDLPREISVRPLVSVAPLASYYTTDGKADITQIGFITSREFQLGKKVTLPVKIDMIYNPDRDALYTAFGVTAKF